MSTKSRQGQTTLAALSLAALLLAFPQISHAADEAATAPATTVAKKHAHKHKNHKPAVKSSKSSSKAPVTSAHSPLHASLTSGGITLPDAPAVSGLNGSIDVRGGADHGSMVGLTSGSVSIPVMHDFGLQFDGTVGTIGGQFAKGFEGHAFYRNPSKFLVGAILQRSWLEGQAYNRYGAEGEYYTSRITYVARAGYQNGDIHRGEFTNLELNWYANDNLAITPGFRNSANHDWGRIGVEWQPEMIKAAPGLALFASASAGNYGYAAGLVGIRYYIGENKTLIRRHREDDPATILPEDMADNFSQFHKAAPAAPVSIGSGGPT